MRIRPAELFHQCGRIVGIVGHGEGAITLPALAQTALVIGQDLEVTGQRAAKPGFRPPQVAAGAPDQQQGEAGTLTVIKEGVTLNFGKWHGLSPGFEILLQSTFADR
jgi:hypothetical protein